MSINFTIFQKPSRYIGNEVNIAGKKMPDTIRVALCFPDTYEIGMSHLGLKILYSIINSRPYASAERVFAPWTDYEAYLRESKLPLSSLESGLALKDFDIAGFTLQYELSYTNVLNMLDLGGIPLRADSRNDDHPLIIAGGPCAVNPLPLAPFIDAFAIGDGEEAVKQIIETYKIRNPKSEIRNKKNLLNALSEIEGVYVPAVHDTGNKKIRRRTVADLNTAPFPQAPVVPYASAVHDRVTVEISRGCTRGCRFCQAGIIYRPLRERSVSDILSIVKNSVENTGYEDISFSSLSVGDYSSLLPLIRTFNSMCRDSNIATSLPSLRVGAVNDKVLDEIKSVRKTGFTIAPEAGSQRLRNVINKDFTEEEYESTLEKLFGAGWQSIKLYFMIGLPTETREDIDGIARMAGLALKKGKKIAGKRANINVGISAFVPKPHTPFQWTGQLSSEELRLRQDRLKKALRKKGLNFKGQHVETSILEAVFSRGDADSAPLLETAWKLGCRFDGWSEMFDFNKWLAAAEVSGIDLYKYASRKLDMDSELPWGFIDTGVTDKFLRSEYDRAIQGKITRDCINGCHGCGLECEDRMQSAERGARNGESFKSELRTPNSEFKRPHLSKNLPTARFRLRFSKTGILKYLSHREVMTTVIRAMRRADIPVAYSRGFHPHPKVSFGPALPVGVEGVSEYLDVDLSGPVVTARMVQGLNSQLPEGLEVHSAVPTSKTQKSLVDFISRYEYEIFTGDNPAQAVNAFLGLKELMVKREKKTVNIRPMVESAKIDGPCLRLVLVDAGGTRARLYELLETLLKKPLKTIQKMSIKRVGLYGRGSEEWADPMEREKLCLTR